MIQVIRRRGECSTFGDNGGSNDVSGVMGHIVRSFSRGQRVGFGRLEISGVDGQGRRRSCVRDDEGQVECDRLNQLPSLYVAVGEDERNVYTQRLAN